MNNRGIDLLFPANEIPSLVDLRGENWRSLVNNISSSDPESLEILAFTLLMARLVNCTFCNSDSYRALHGCAQCTRQALHRFRGSDDDLISQFDNAKSEVQKYLDKKKDYE
jgi:hypothetical protein